jgi:hypothetical protein
MVTHDILLLANSIPFVTYSTLQRKAHALRNGCESFYFPHDLRHLQILCYPCLIWHPLLLLNLTYNLLILSQLLQYTWPIRRPKIPYSKSHERFHLLRSFPGIRPTTSKALHSISLYAGSAQWVTRPSPKPQFGGPRFDGSVCLFGQHSPSCPPYLEVAISSHNLTRRTACWLLNRVTRNRVILKFDMKGL